MQWIHQFQLFLFDFDGLLVNTEAIHYQAYVDMLRSEGIETDWSFSKFCELAHLNASALKEALYAHYPQLDPDWNRLYGKKKQMYYELIGAGRVGLMPGVEALLRALDQAKIQRCVVTNSFRDQIDLIRSQIAALQTIPHWITRENYDKPKPAPDGYLRAIELYGKKGDRIIGFEDSVRGLESLRQTPALPVLICPAHHPLLELALDGGKALHFESLSLIKNL